MGFFCGDESISKPYKSSTVSSTWLFSVGFTVPAVIILVAELGEKTEWNWRVQVMVIANPASDVNLTAINEVKSKDYSGDSLLQLEK